MASTVAQGQELAKSLLGIDLAALAQRFTAGAANGHEVDAVPPPPPPADLAVAAGTTRRHRLGITRGQGLSLGPPGGVGRTTPPA